MSANAQTFKCSRSQGTSQTIRAATVRSPIQLLGLEAPEKLAKLKREVSGLKWPRLAESLIDADLVLDGFDRARHFAPESEIFIRAGLASDLATIGLFGRTVIHSDTLWEGLKASQKAMAYCQSLAEVQLRLKNGRCSITFEPHSTDHPGSTANIQYFVALYVYLLRKAEWYDGGDLRLSYPGGNSEHCALFPEAIAIQSGPLGVVEFSDRLLRSPIGLRDPCLNAVAADATDRFTGKNLSEKDLPQVLHGMQISSIRIGQSALSQKDAAFLLDLPVRTLQHYLKSSGISFADIRNNALHSEAKRLLRSGYSIRETSSFLGFDHRQSFSEAFSKWQGTPPSIFASRAGNVSGVADEGGVAGPENANL